MTAQHYIEHLELLPHPEGGYYKESYRSAGTVAASCLSGFGGDRSFSTAIYFLLEQGDFSAFHRIKSDECWHFYTGDPLMIYVIQQNGMLDIITLGNDLEKGQLFQYVIPANCWFASRPAPGSEYCFVGCTVSPGFEFDDLELADANELITLYPAHKDIIGELCR